MNREAAIPVEELVEELAPQRRFQPYPEYRDSGVELPGQVPQHWTLRRVKQVARFAYGDSLSAENRNDGDVDVYGSNGPVDRHNRANTQGPCLVIGRKGSFGKVNYSSNPCFAIDTTYFIDDSQTRADIRWLYYALNWLQLDSFSKDSAVPGLAREDAYFRLVPHCELDEQRQIAAFLDRETAKIDELVAKKRRLIELLKEKRTALISHAVTKGLDPDAPMKDSGIEWLGQVPEHWDVKKLRYLCSIQTGDKDTVDAIDGAAYPFFVRSQTVERINSFTFNCEAVLTAGDGVGVGKVFHHYTGKFDVHQRVYVMNRFKGLTGRYLFYFLKEHFYRVALEGSAKSTVDSLRRHMFTDFPIPVPPKDNVARIVKYLDTETERLDDLVSMVCEAIDNLREYRSALISAAVTGKIDVRGIEPEEAPCQ